MGTSPVVAAAVTVAFPTKHSPTRMYVLISTIIRSYLVTFSLWLPLNLLRYAIWVVTSIQPSPAEAQLNGRPFTIIYCRDRGGSDIMDIVTVFYYFFPFRSRKKSNMAVTHFERANIILISITS